MHLIVCNALKINKNGNDTSVFLNIKKDASIYEASFLKGK